jgi:hypothetical protein
MVLQFEGWKHIAYCCHLYLQIESALSITQNAEASSLQ